MAKNPLARERKLSKRNNPGEEVQRGSVSQDNLSRLLRASHPHKKDDLSTHRTSHKVPRFFTQRKAQFCIKSVQKSPQQITPVFPSHTTYYPSKSGPSSFTLKPVERGFSSLVKLAIVEHTHRLLSQCWECKSDPPRQPQQFV